MKIRKAVIPAAGFGTRMLPAAKAVPKELLPVLDKPVIQYVVEECVAAGIEQICLVISRDKPALLAHFAPHAVLESRLNASGKSALLQSLVELRDRVKIDAVYQDEQLGLGHAVGCARTWVNDEPFLCLLGDTIFTGDVLPATQLVDVAQRHASSVIGLEQVAREKVSRYGIVAGESMDAGLWQLTDLVEKPKVDEAPSNLAIAARYVLTPAIFEELDRTPRGAGGEIQLTDAIRQLLKRQSIYGALLTGKRHDIGNPVDWLATNLFLARRSPELWSKLEPLIRSLQELNP